MGELALSARGHLVAPLLLALVAVVAGCGGDDDGPAGSRSARAPRQVEARAGRPPRPSPYGQDGRLLPSDVVVAGLPLPRGFEVTEERDRVTVLRGRVPVDKALAYFGPLLITGNVERIGAGARYHDAVPAGVQGGVVHLDVSVLPRSSGGTRVEIVERLPEGAEPAPDPGRAEGSEAY